MSQLQKQVKAAASEQGISSRKIAKRVGLRYQTVSDFLNERGNPRRSTIKLICQFFGLDTELSENVPILEPEAQASLEVARKENTVLAMMAIEDAQIELQEIPALERLTERLKIYGKRNQYGHKQLRNVVYSDNVLLEVFEDSDPEAISETRAKELLEVLA